MGLSSQIRERLERTLVTLSREQVARAASTPRGRARRQAEKPEQTAQSRPAPPAPPQQPVEASPSQETLVVELPQLDELLQRLERLEDRLADLQGPSRPLPATRDIFSEWVRLRRWEEMPFSDFLTLRRAGRI